MACFRILTADRTALSPRISDAYRFQFFVCFLGLQTASSGIPTNLPLSLWTEISQAVDTIIEDKDMFVTNEGYVGLGHEGCAVGDAVCIFLGGEVLFLVRADVEGEQKGFKFMGECYVHGIMDGEAMDSGRTLEQFLLL